MLSQLSPSSRDRIDYGESNSFSFIGSKGCIGVSLYMADTTITGMENSYILIYNSFKYYLLLQLEQFNKLLRERQDPHSPL